MNPEQYYENEKNSPRQNDSENTCMDLRTPKGAMNGDDRGETI